MSSKTLLQWLQGAGLEQLYDVFIAHDITAERLPRRQLQDYDRMGSVEPPLRQKLFRLVQTAKRDAAAQPAQTPQQQQQTLAPTQVLPRNVIAQAQQQQLQQQQQQQLQQQQAAQAAQQRQLKAPSQIPQVAPKQQP